MVEYLFGLGGGEFSFIDRLVVKVTLIDQLMVKISRINRLVVELPLLISWW